MRLDRDCATSGRAAPPAEGDHIEPGGAGRRCERGDAARAGAVAGALYCAGPGAAHGGGRVAEYLLCEPDSAHGEGRGTC